MSKPYSALTLCRNALRVDETELAELERQAIEQRDYIHPLKLATQARLNKLGNHNLAVIGKVRELIETIKEAP